MVEKADQWQGLIQENLSVLWDETAGMFLAASHYCRQIDIWGSIYACHIHAATEAQRRAILEWLRANRDRYVYRHHLRHLPEPEYWEQTIPAHTKRVQGEFQNGAFWTTPGGWYAELLESASAGAGVRFLEGMVRDLRDIGIWECIGRDGYRRVKDNLSSVLLPYASFNRIRADRQRGKQVASKAP